MTVGIVVPCFNEAGRWNSQYWFGLLGESQSRFLFVDDGSTDHTSDLAKAAVRNSDSHVLELPRNMGKAEAVRLGMIELMADPELSGVGYLDADGAFGVEDVVRIERIYQSEVLLGEVDAVWSSRVALAGRDIRRSNFRHYTGRVIATFLSGGFDSFPYDTQSGYKVFRPSTTLATALASPFNTRWLFEIELLKRWVSIAQRPMLIREEPLEQWHDVPGSKIKGKEVLRILRELVTVRFGS